MIPKILVVDDESPTRRLMTYLLERMGFEVIAAADAEDALAVADEHHFVMGFIDVNMPVMDGFTLILELRSKPRLADVPFVLFTARSHPDDQNIIREIGAAGILYKPFSTQNVHDLVVQILGSRDT